ncbi:elongation factor Ts [Perkinsela sp. CCAP 1560/4]|nr:elongation factor Ts [Perkinsela sp. CCAP 1560/4]|eukprot:KNH09679.1 elongation factor Ts [Perkinsela sp. CCAP 1560/4]
MECVNSCGLDREKCISWLKENCSTAKFQGRKLDTKKGLLVCATEAGHSACILEVNCQTDFAAMSTNFVQFAAGLQKHLRSTEWREQDELLHSVRHAAADSIQLLCSQLKEDIQISQLRALRAPPQSTGQSVFGSYQHMLGGEHTPGIGHIAAIIQLASSNPLAHDKLQQAQSVADGICRHMVATSGMYDLTTTTNKESTVSRFDKPLEDQRFMGEGASVKEWMQQEVGADIRIIDYDVRRVR